MQSSLIEGKSYTEIAKIIGCSKSTVKYYIKKYNIPIQDFKKRQKEKTLRGKTHPLYGKTGEKSKRFGCKHSEETKIK